MHGTFFTKVVDSLSSVNTNCGGSGFNAHYWIVDERGKRIDPTPATPENSPLHCKNGSVKPFYKEYSEDIQFICNRHREDDLLNMFEDAAEVVEYIDDFYEFPRYMMCYQNCKAYIRRHPDCNMVCGAFGYIIDVHPNPCPPELKKLKKYVSLDYGY